MGAFKTQRSVLASSRGVKLLSADHGRRWCVVDVLRTASLHFYASLSHSTPFPVPTTAPALNANPHAPRRLEQPAKRGRLYGGLLPRGRGWRREGACAPPRRPTPARAPNAAFPAPPTVCAGHLDARQNHFPDPPLTPQQGKGATDNKRVVSLTVKQLHSATAGGEGFKVDGVELSHVRVMGRLLDIHDDASSCRILLHDGTGSIQFTVYTDASEQWSVERGTWE